MSRHDPPLPGQPDARMAQRLAALERRMQGVENRFAGIGESFGNLNVQVGKFTYAVTTAAGGTAAEVTLPKAWPTKHLSFLATVRALTSGTGLQITLCGPINNLAEASLSKGLLYVESSVNQNVEVWWTSIGY